MLTLDTLNTAIETARAKCAALDADKAEGLDKALAITFQEHFEFQTMQSTAHAGGILSLDAATLIYRALGNSVSSSNGGWSAGTDTATKVVITQVMHELLTKRLTVGARA